MRVGEQLTLLTGLWGLGLGRPSVRIVPYLYVVGRERWTPLAHNSTGGSTLRSNKWEWVPGGGLWGCQMARSRD